MRAETRNPVQAISTAILNLSQRQIRFVNIGTWALIGIAFLLSIARQNLHDTVPETGFGLLATLFFISCYLVTSALIRHLWEIKEYQTVILEVQKSLFLLNDPRLMYDDVVKQIVQKTDAIAAYIVIPDENTGFLSIQSASEEDASQGTRERNRYVTQICPTEAALKVMDSRNIYGPLNPKSSGLLDISKDVRTFSQKVRSVLALPVFINKHEQPYAVLVIEAIASVYFSAETIKSIQTLCNSLGEAISRYMETKQLVEAKSHFENIAHIDELTGLRNRRSLELDLPLAINRAKASGLVLATVLLDLDEFKPVNDTFGHECGDEVLQAVGERLVHGMRDCDSVYRLGGDEFVLLMENLHEESEIPLIMEKIASLIRQPILLSSGDGVSINLSAGIDLYRGSSRDNPGDIIRRADQALYSIKSRKESRKKFWTLFAA